MARHLVTVFIGREEERLRLATTQTACFQLEDAVSKRNHYQIPPSPGVKTGGQIKE